MVVRVWDVYLYQGWLDHYRNTISMGNLFRRWYWWFCFWHWGPIPVRMAGTENRLLFFLKKYHFVCGKALCVEQTNCPPVPLVCRRAWLDKRKLYFRIIRMHCRLLEGSNKDKVFTGYFYVKAGLPQTKLVLRDIPRQCPKSCLLYISKGGGKRNIIFLGGRGR